MATLEEKRVYRDSGTGTELLLAADLGVVSVGVAGDAVGEFGVSHRCAARDVAAGPDTIAVATDEDVLLGPTYEPTGFGPAVAVGLGDGVLAAGPDGRVARYGERAEEWTALGEVDAVRALDGELIAAESGVHHTRDGLPHAGLDDARDVAAAGPLAATGAGVYRLGNGWLEGVSGDARVVAAEGRRAHAVVAETLYARTGDGWRATDPPVDAAIADVAHGPAVYAVTESGTVLVDAGDGWRSRALGIGDVAALAVAPDGEAGEKSV
jgi:hypothetical protein